MFKETDSFKAFRSPAFNYFFDKKTGFTATYGVTKEHDPEVAPFPMIADIEITERCSGPGNKNNGNYPFHNKNGKDHNFHSGSGPCRFCYKANTENKGSVMSLATFKKICDKLPRELTQIAFGTDAKLESNPEWFDIFKYARSSGFIPNVTVANITEEKANMLASVCGAVAVSRYEDKNWCYDSLNNLKNERLPYRNIHILVSQETLPWIYETFEDFHKDPRLEGVTAIVLLSLKKKGRGIGFHRCTDEQFKAVVNKALELDIPFGMDSCSAHKAMNALKNHPNYKNIKPMIEPCESFGIQSMYINAEGKYFPCSFAEGCKGWEEGLDVVNCNNFIEDIWNSPKLAYYRELSLSCGRGCLFYNV